MAAQLTKWKLCCHCLKDLPWQTFELTNTSPHKQAMECQVSNTESRFGHHFIPIQNSCTCISTFFKLFYLPYLCWRTYIWRQLISCWSWTDDRSAQHAWPQSDQGSLTAPSLLPSVRVDLEIEYHNITVQISYNMVYHNNIWHINGLVQDCSNSIANTLELLQSFTKPWNYDVIMTGAGCRSDYKLRKQLPYLNVFVSILEENEHGMKKLCCMPFTQAL